MDSRRYHYEPLDASRQEIRILKVHAAVNSPTTTTVHCTLSTVSLLHQPAPIYHTISYRWGDVRDRAYIIVDDCLLDVSRAAERVLRRFRSHVEDVVLWIDAICINQRDLEERSQQVAMMADIFSKTVSGYIWLGEERETTALAIEGIKAIVDDAKRETGHDFQRLLDEFFKKRGHIFTSPKAPSIDADAFGPALVEFFSADWFSRLWIVQEAVLAPRSVCCVGHLEIQLTTVLLCAAWLLHKAKFIPAELFRLENVGNVAQIWIMSLLVDGLFDFGFLETPSRAFAPDSRSLGWSRHPHFHMLVDALGQFRASDPRDHVFALLGLYQSVTKYRELPKELTVDYAKSVREVYTDSAWHTIRETANLRLLSDIHHRSFDFESSTIGLPSWVPCWQEVTNLTLDPIKLRDTFRADHPRESVEFATESPLHDVLSIHGIRVGTVMSVAQTLTKAEMLSTRRKLEHIDVLRSFQALAAIASEKTTDGDVLAVTLCAGTCFVEQPLTSRRASIGLQVCLRHLADDGDLPPLNLGEAMRRPPGVDQDEMSPSEFDFNWRHAYCNRRLFATQEGHLGLASVHASSGDVVAVLYGCQWPVILRPMSVGYRLVSIAYVHGIMDGEAVQEPRSSDDESKTFHIF